MEREVYSYDFVEKPQAFAMNILIIEGDKQANKVVMQRRAIVEKNPHHSTIFIQDQLENRPP
jgi:hypothetical protein